LRVVTGKARRLKQAKEEAQQEIEAYRQDCEKQYREHEAKVCDRIARISEGLSSILVA